MSTPETWTFDIDNEGDSFRPGYGLLDEHGQEVGIFIETGWRFDDEKQLERGKLAAAAPALLQELKNIARAPRKNFKTAEEFQDWARSRAWHAVAKVLGNEWDQVKEGDLT